MSEIAPAGEGPRTRSSPGTRDEARRFVDVMQRRALEALRPVRADGAFALVDYPDYSNVGDVAIWLGTLNMLSRLNGGAPAYTSTLRGFDPGRCRDRIGTGTVYFSGGGNLGNLYARHHALRLAAMEAMPGNRIVQLPQSFAWVAADDSLVSETRQVFAARQVTLFCREQPSLDAARERLGIDAGLCPDLAFGLGVLPRQEASAALHYLLRRDLEATAEQAVRSDWRDCSPMMMWRRVGRLIEAASGLVDPSGAHAGLQARTFVARRKLDAGLRFLSRGDYLVTDRLHGHILAILLGIPHSLRDNRTGKNRAFWQAWTRELSFARFETQAGEPA